MAAWRSFRRKFGQSR